jgi:hypothetical protein
MNRIETIHQLRKIPKSEFHFSTKIDHHQPNHAPHQNNPNYSHSIHTLPQNNPNTTNQINLI